MHLNNDGFNDYQIDKKLKETITMMKKFFALIMASLLLILAGCGSNQTSSTEKGSTSEKGEKTSCYILAFHEWRSSRNIK